MGHLEKAVKLLESLEKCPSNVRFADLCNLAEAAGFIFDRQKGSHRIYRHERFPGIMNFQDVHGQAKPYQVKQLLAFISDHGLLKKGVGDA